MSVKRATHTYAVNVHVPLPLIALPLHGDADAESLFRQLFDAEAASFWLDAGAEADAGWSILGTGRVETNPDAVRAVPLAAHGSADASGRDARASSGVPFLGGWTGWLSYEDGAAASGAPIAASALPETSAWIAVERAIAIEHETGRAFALADADAIDTWQHTVQTALAAGIPSADDAFSDQQTAIARHDVDEYVSLVEECRAAIARGDAYQLCLTTRFAVARPRDPLAVYLRLRTATPAHHGGYLRIGERHLLSASPEQFLAVEDGHVLTSPIKGTRPRGTTADDDAALAEELRTDVKERAENVMIVDLMRNDLSRIGVPGSVQVTRLWEVESYPAVHQLVSTVTARLREGMTAGDLCDAAFPAGSMTGAPKLSAMSILCRLEQGARGVYSGCFGYVGLDGRVDLAMIIRSIVITAGGAYVGAGGGITWLSRPKAEAAEAATKARAPLAALGADLPLQWAALLAE